MFESILIANRGEIACRVIATCKRLGVRAVAVFSEADRDSRFVAEADEAYFIGRSEPSHSYLRADLILDAALRAGAQAIHPGYGFLSENAGFARACAARGITFIGPPPEAIEAMGLKDAAKARMEAAGVRVVPDHRGSTDPGALLRAAREIGFPVLIKAVAGGGGKGMRRVDDAQSFPQLLESAQREARAAFGDSRVLLEKYLARARHIEVQVFADRHGEVVHLFERDCSLQRRHQKVIEEAPAVGASPEFQRAIYDLAVRATRAVNYEGAGTIELIADVSQGLDPERVYFMEMNTRLQVEHPITESITGLDLVEWQLRVAAGEPLPLKQEQLVCRGHAIEARLYAEDPARDYLPQSGKLTHLKFPQHARVDAGFRQGDTISVYYDALIAKLIVWGHDRGEATRKLQHALAGVEVAGLTSNLQLLTAIAHDPDYLAGALHIGYLAERLDVLLREDPALTERLWILACAGRLAARQRGRSLSPWSDTRAFRNTGPHADVLGFRQRGERVDVPVVFEGELCRLGLPSREVEVRAVALHDQQLSCEHEGRKLSGVYVATVERSFVFHAGHTLELGLAAAARAPGEVGQVKAGETTRVLAPMPGKIHAVSVEQGARVSKGQALLSLEAMKMEHTLRAPCAGIVRTLSANVGEQVEEGRSLVVLEAEEPVLPPREPGKEA
jgi:3-methylcrotonyl-CoA carboxylase alpha subunit